MNKKIEAVNELNPVKFLIKKPSSNMMTIGMIIFIPMFGLFSESSYMAGNKFPSFLLIFIAYICLRSTIKYRCISIIEKNGRTPKIILFTKGYCLSVVIISVALILSSSFFSYGLESHKNLGALAHPVFSILIALPFTIMIPFYKFVK